MRAFDRVNHPRLPASLAAARRHWRAAAVRRSRPALLALAIALGDAAPPPALAAEAREPGLPEVIVGTTPLPGTAVAIEELPGEAHSLDMARRGGTASEPAAALAARYASIGLEDTLGDARQPSLAFRGFTASPVLGTSQGLAVYQNGVRQNEAFGDVVNWDLVPLFATRRIDVAGASPVYGANALGGAVLLTMKSGLTDDGLSAEAEGGSFGARAGTLEYGVRRGALALYVGAHSLDEDGARQYSANALRQLYADLRYAGSRDTIALGVGAADNRLNGPGAAPLAELAISRSLTFTGPQQTRNRLGFATLSVESRLAADLTFAGVVYYRHLRQALANGNRTDYVPCSAASAAGLVCQADGTTPLVGLNGAPVPDPSGGGARPLGENDSESVRTTSAGASLQLAGRATLLGTGHALALGAALDSARVDFASTVAVGAIDPALQVASGGPLIATAEGSTFAATPVGLAVERRVLAWHASDTVALAPRLALTGSAQYAIADLELTDLRGTALSGTSRYQRLNPGVGFTYRLASGATVYAGYAETTRSPSPSEIECSDPQRPCLLPSSLAGDPPRLRQVVAHTWEAGLRQSAGVAGIGGLGASVALFRADLADDIYGIATGTGTGYYANIGATRRAGVSVDASYRDGAWTAFVGGALVDATFRSALALPAPQNPYADAAGDILVRPGAHLPGIARLRATAGLEWRATRALRLGAQLSAVGPSYYHGDESNQNPRLPGYARLDLQAGFAAGERVELTLGLSNVLDARYSTYGLYADPTGVGAPGVPASATPADPALDRRFESPAPPRAVRLALRVRL